MKAKALLVALALAAAPALASNCPNEMKAIDEAIPKAKQKSAADMNEVKRLRMEGEKMHAAGNHKESMAALAKAKGILGIK